MLIRKFAKRRSEAIAPLLVAYNNKVELTVSNKVEPIPRVEPVLRYSPASNRFPYLSEIKRTLRVVEKGRWKWSKKDAGETYAQRPIAFRTYLKSKGRWSGRKRTLELVEKGRWRKLCSASNRFPYLSEIKRTLEVVEKGRSELSKKDAQHKLFCCIL